MIQKVRKLFCCLLLLIAAASHVQAQKIAKPNIILIVADDLGYGDLGSYGNEIIKTPNIDKLAAQGIRFTDAYAGASVCSPSRGTLLTGKHTGHARIRGNMTRQGGVEGLKDGVPVRRPSLLDSDSTVAQILQQQGYRTFLVNKWHVEGFSQSAYPQRKGFDEFSGWLVSEPRSHNHYPEIRFKGEKAYSIAENRRGKQQVHATDMTTQEATAVIKQQHEKPFFLMVTYNAPHVPLHAKNTILYDQLNLPAQDKAYAAMVSHLDEGVGAIVKATEEQAITGETVVIFVSDNGGSREAKLAKLKQNGPLRGMKADLYEGGLRVPLIIKYGASTVGSVSTFPTYFPDLYATLLDMAAAAHFGETDGISLLPEILAPNSQQPAADRFLYWEQYPARGIAQAVRWGDWKLISPGNEGAIELYNLRTDIGETTNVAEKHADITKKLQAFLQEAHVPSDWWPVNER
ncbi:sulfatase-like hydrolase/transferase [Sphingobacterium oryzagri]|uniref:Sulfatase-like hydrolase/transferase n=1 Tax=Sphingobacterium oryzagri TaxID=3025669 RepID=A0ABY7WB23_9SPHI|nr:sulfatase-like hydrolase/transferase [Sphingobacterium sp. KACC 22765]WDF66861.1 sulfatase-like hydrolase/transferase [Sphingobacterium sp. KACC 22765]